MTDYQQNKSLVLHYYEELDKASENDIAKVLKRYTTDDYLFHGMHPFNEIKGAESVADLFWKPLRTSFKPIQRRQDIFMAGTSEIDGTEWVCSLGHLMGLFDEDWLGIPATRKMVFLPYAEFNQITDGKISETGSFCDIVRVMQQAGVSPLPLQTGAAIVTPGPKPHDGLLFDDQDLEESAKTLGLINRMVADLTESDLQSPLDKLKQHWHDDMIWFGPSGIGATYSLNRYQLQHQGPFRQGFDNIVFHGHRCQFAEGNYGGFFGWAELTMNPKGGFIGMPGSDKTVGMHILDIYRRDDDKFAENWVFIDMLYFLKQQGLDVLERVQGILSNG
ncbi:MAG: ester cyclase [Anaerolineae bacterium]|nr:ester cyclase [Anaerolineae bacterium]MDK1082001.1 ester cyclase [Anaerolineae bacterium]MDK1119319.1 ester cyclase [Anaerolineae bacterium]